MRAAAFGGENGAGDNEEFAIVFRSETRRYQRTGTFFCFDNKYRFAKTHHDAISLRECIVCRFHVWFEFRKMCTACFHDLSRKIHVRARIEHTPIKPRAGYGNSREPRLKSGLMCLGIHPVGQPTHNDNRISSQSFYQMTHGLPTVTCCRAASDDRKPEFFV